MWVFKNRKSKQLHRKTMILSVRIQSSPPPVRVLVDVADDKLGWLVSTKTVFDQRLRTGSGEERWTGTLRRRLRGKHTNSGGSGGRWRRNCRFLGNRRRVNCAGVPCDKTTRAGAGLQESHYRIITSTYRITYAKQLSQGAQSAGEQKKKSSLWRCQDALRNIFILTDESP